MKVLHIIAGMDPRAGGVTTAVNTMIDGLSGFGIESEVVCLDDPSESYIRNLPSVHGLGPSKTAWRFSSALLPWLKANITKFDAVIVHGLWQYHVYAVYKAWKKLKTRPPKLFIMPHGMLDPYFQKATDRKLKAIRNRIFWKLAERKAVNEADCILFTCETEKILSFQSFKPYSPKRAEVSGLGIASPPALTLQMEKVFAAKCNGADPRGCLLFISRIHPKKGVDLLINAYKELRQAQPLLPLLVIAGPGLETDFGKQMQTLAGETGDILFTGMLEGDEKWGAFYSAGAMILPSHQENFGFVVVEALACGKPVLISNQVNIWREVQASNAGIIGDDTADGVRQLIRAWMDLSAAARAEMKTAARTAYEQYFSLNGAANKLDKIIRDVCNA